MRFNYASKRIIREFTVLIKLNYNDKNLKFYCNINKKK